MFLSQAGRPSEGHSRQPPAPVPPQRGSLQPQLLGVGGWRDPGGGGLAFCLPRHPLSLPCPSTAPHDASSSCQGITSLPVTAWGAYRRSPMPSAKPNGCADPKATLLNARGQVGEGSANLAHLSPALPRAQLAPTTACARPPPRRAGTGSSYGKTASAGPRCTASSPPRHRASSPPWRRARWALGARGGGGLHSNWLEGGHGGSP